MASKSTKQIVERQKGIHVDGYAAAAASGGRVFLTDSAIHAAKG
jgi:hypothetical protein